MSRFYCSMCSSEFPFKRLNLCVFVTSLLLFLPLFRRKGAKSMNQRKPMWQRRLLDDGLSVICKNNKEHYHNHDPTTCEANVWWLVSLRGLSSDATRCAAAQCLAWWVWWVGGLCSVQEIDLISISFISSLKALCPYGVLKYPDTRSQCFSTYGWKKGNQYVR